MEKFYLNCLRSAQISLSAALLNVGLVAVGHTGSPIERDVLFFNTPPTLVEMEQHLFPPRVATRGLVLKKPDIQPEIQSEIQQAPRVAVEKSIGLPVLFHFGKTTLVSSSKPYLDKVGELMQQPANREETLIIEGHTDAVGTEVNNRRLSELRALAVRDYLVNHYGIDPLRLFAQGKGENQLFDSRNPYAGVNRRVEFLRYPL